MYLERAFSPLNEPYDTIQRYLNVPLSEKSPFIYTSHRIIKAQSTKEFIDIPSKAKEQSELFKKVINYLQSCNSLFPFDFDEIRSSSNQISTSGDSTHQSKKYERRPYRSLSSSQDKQNKIEKSVDYSLIAKLELILTVARDAIQLYAKNQTTLETFHRNALANALECHLNYSIKPLFEIPKLHKHNCSPLLQRSHSPIEEKSEKEELIKSFPTDTLDKLIHYWLKGGSGIKITSSFGGYKASKEDKALNKQLCQLEKHFINDLKKEISFIKESKILYSQSMKEVIEEATLRELSKQSIETVAGDITRQLQYIKIFKDEKLLFPLDKVTLSKTYCFDSQVEKLKNILEIMFNLLENEPSKDSFFPKIELLKEDVTKNIEGFQDLCSLFFKGLEEGLKKKEGDVDFLPLEKVRLLTLTLTQKTYSLTGIIISQILEKLKIKVKSGEGSHWIDYHFKKKDNYEIVELCSGFEAISETNHYVEFYIENALEAHLENLHNWSSTILISLKINTTNKDKREEIEEMVIKPLNEFGFPIKILP